MILAGLRSRLPLWFHLLAGVAAVLAVFGGATIVVSGVKQAREYRETVGAEIAITLDVLERELAGAAVIDDYATIEQMLEARAAREGVDEIVWRDARGNPVRAQGAVAGAVRPAWFAAWVALAPPPAARPLRVGGVSYGQIEVRFNAVTLENRLWDSVGFAAAMFAGMLVAVFAIVAALLRRGLRPIERLTEVAARIGAGDFTARIAATPGDPPEMRVALAAFNRMADDVERLMRDLARAEDELRRSHDALEEKVKARTVDLSAANAALVEEKARQQALIEKLEQAHNQLLQSEKMASIGQLAAGVAHEINNPIGFVSSNLGTLRIYVDRILRLLAAFVRCEGHIPDAARGEIEAEKAKIDLPFLREDLPQLLAESADGLQRVKRIVEDLKDFSRVDEAEWQAANLERGLDSTLRVVWNEIKYKAEVVKEYAGLPDVACLAAQLNQVFANLLVNAAQAIDGHGRITVRTGYDDDDIWIEVADSGCGIPREHLSRIFDPFFTTKPVGKGTGLGLSLSYGIVQKHGGRIDVDSEPGQGASFRVVLPRRRATGDDAVTASSALRQQFIG